jgi:hypothetical protein
MKEKADSPIVLYSANSWLAYIIAERYYGGYHYIWCTPHFDPSAVPSISYTVPPSSSPIEIYRGLREDVKRGDRHSAKIAANKAGILRGVEYKMASGEITKDQASEIASIVDAAEPQDFKPLIFVVPFSLVKKTVREVPVSQRAHPLSNEFIVDRLPRNHFDVIDFDGRL